MCQSLEDWINYVASLYVFGERVMDGLFQDAIISALIDHCTRTNKTVSLSLVRIIYQGTTSSSPARRLMVDVCEFDSGPKANKLQFLEVDKDGEFMLDLIVAMAKHRKPACGVSGYLGSKNLILTSSVLHRSFRPQSTRRRVGTPWTRQTSDQGKQLTEEIWARRHSAFAALPLLQYSRLDLMRCAAMRFTSCMS
jgi:hypothetical protein